MPVANTEGKVDVSFEEGELANYSDGRHTSYLVLPRYQKVIVRVEPEVLLAQAILSIEPPKIEGGSPPRQSWLGLMTYAMDCLFECGYDIHKFKERMEQ